MKLLYILNIAKRVNNFSESAMLAAKNLGIDFHIAGNWGYSSEEERKKDEENYGIHIHQIDFIRTPYHPGNKVAYKQLLSLMKKENFDAIHANTPIGGVLGRLCASKLGIKKVIYQAHGFHFYKGASKKNWMIFYPIEKNLAKKTDALITINQEDYNLANQKMKLRGNGKIYYVPGVGMELSAYEKVADERAHLREQIHLPENAILGLSMGDLISRKDYATAIKGLALCKESLSEVHLAICGKGPEEERLKSLAKELSIEDNVHFLGYCDNVKEWLKAADFFFLSSLQEGLPRSTMEAMASGLPLITARIRGNVDLFEEGKGGVFFTPKDAKNFGEKLIELLSMDLEQIKKNNLEQIKRFSLENATNEIEQIYQKELLQK